mgnify:CR=1 FL=1
MISAAAILMLCNGIRIFLKSKKNTINEIGCVMEFMTHLFRFFIFSFLHFFVSSFFSSDFTDESEAFLLIGLLTEFRGTLAAGQWLAPYMLLLFLSRRFRRWRRFFFVGIILSHRFRRYTQIFLCGGLFRPTDFTDIRRFFLGRFLKSRRFRR